MPTKICPQCNKEFFTKHKHTVHCSSKCSGLSKRTHSFEKVCELKALDKMGINHNNIFNFLI